MQLKLIMSSKTPKNAILVILSKMIKQNTRYWVGFLCMLWLVSSGFAFGQSSDYRILVNKVPASSLAGDEEILRRSTLGVHVDFVGDVQVIEFTGEQYRPTYNSTQNWKSISKVTLHFDEEVVEKLEMIVQKASEWATIAEKNRVEVIKHIACFGSDPLNMCHTYQVAADDNQMVVSFMTPRGGKPSKILISLRETMLSNRLTLVFEEHEWQALSRMLRKIYDIGLLSRQEKKKIDDLFK